MSLTPSHTVLYRRVQSRSRTRFEISNGALGVSARGLLRAVCADRGRDPVRRWKGEHHLSPAPGTSVDAVRFVATCVNVLRFFSSAEGVQITIRCGPDRSIDRPFPSPY